MSSNIVNLANHRKLHDSINCYMNVNDSVTSLDHVFETLNTGRHTRQDELVNVMVRQTTNGMKAYSIRGPQQWNVIPSLTHVLPT